MSTWRCGWICSRSYFFGAVFSVRTCVVCYPEEFRRKMFDLVAAGRPVATIANELQIRD
jgi:hypothetical protein